MRRGGRSEGKWERWILKHKTDRIEHEGAK